MTRSGNSAHQATTATMFPLFRDARQVWSRFTPWAGSWASVSCM